jgi:uncharacterized hydantoinase/oxoprolinase family protein
MAEFFATTADAHRVAGTLPADADLHPAADGRGKSADESRARLARMIGMDASPGDDEIWRLLAESFIRCQLRQIEAGAELVLSAARIAATAPVVGAGSGRFLAAEVARRLARPYRALDSTLPLADPALASAAADIAPAAAVALLLGDG